MKTKHNYRLLATALLAILTTAAAWAVQAPGIDWNSNTHTFTLYDYNDGATIYYTIDDTDPATSATRKTYTAPFTIDRNIRVRAVAEKNGEVSAETSQRETVETRFFKDGFFYNLAPNTEGNVVELTRASDGIVYQGDVTVKETVTYQGTAYTVVRIGELAFYDCRDLTSIQIPSTVTSIGNSAFYNCDGLKAIDIPSSVKQIGNGVFTDCSNLSKVTLHEGLQTLGNAVFSYCNRLSDIALPSTLTSMGNEVFYACRALKSIAIPNGMTAIGYSAFYDCVNLATVTLPAALTTIDYSAFENTAIRSIDLPSSLTTIGSGVFRNCDYLSSVVVPGSVTSMREGIFQGCDALVSATLSEGLTEVYYRMFRDCTKLSTVSLPSTLTTIGEGAFSGCSALSTVTIPENVAYIDKYAFDGCKLTSVYSLPATPPAFNPDNDGNPFRQHLATATLFVKSASYDNYVHSRWDDFTNKQTIDQLLCAQPVFQLDNYQLSMSSATAGATIYYTLDGTEPTTASTAYTAPIPFMRNATVRAIAVKDGYGQSVVSEFNKVDFKVAAPVATMDEHFVVNITCETADVANFPETTIYYVVNDNSINYSYDDVSYWNWQPYDGQPIQLNKPQFVHVYAVRDGWVTSEPATYNFYSDYSTGRPDFSWNSSTLTMTLYNYDSNATVHYTLDGTTPTADSPVYDPANPIAIDHNLTVKAIAMRAGHFDSDMNTYTVTDVTNKWVVNDYTYRRIDGNPANEVEITSNVNSSKKYEGHVVIPESIEYAGTTYQVTRIGNSAFYECSKLTGVTIPTTVTSIGYRAFEAVGSSFSHVEIPATVKTIEGEAFYGCNALDHVVIPEGVETIGNYAFACCSGMTDISLPSTLTAIGDNAFYDCDALTAIVIPNSVTSLGASALANCQQLSNVSLSNKLTAISNNLLSGNPQLRSVIIPEGVTTISESAFRDNSALVSVVFPSTLKTIGQYAFYNCPSLASVSIPEGTTAIDNYAFQGCRALATVSLPTTLTTIGNYSFDNCKALRTITLPEHLTTLGMLAFINCTALESVYSLPATPPTMSGDAGQMAFRNLTDHVELYVKTAAKDTYQSDLKWAQFNTVKTFDAAPSSQPTFTFDVSTYKLAIASQDAAASIYYTTDGSEPTEQSTLYTGPIPFMQNGTVKAIAVSSGLGASLVSEFSKADFAVPTPTATLDPTTMTVTISCNNPDIEGFPETRYYYFLNDNGYEVDKNHEAWQQVEGNTFQIERPYYVHVYAVRDGWIDSGQSYANFIDDYKLNTPSINWDSSTKTFTVFFYWPDDKASVGNFYYTLDGTEPSKENGTLYTGPFTIDHNLELKALAVADLHFDSEVSTYKVDNLESKFIVDGIYYRKKDYTTANEVEVAPSTDNNAFYTGDITIPSTVDYGGETYTVVGIYNEAFQSAAQLQSISLPATITYINDRAFYGCSRLTSIAIPAQVERIGHDAFNSCYALQTVTLNEGIKTLGNGVFYACGELTTINLPTSLTAIGNGCFKQCTKLTTVVWPASVAVVSDDMFWDSGLSSITLPEGLTTIGSSVFRGCQSLQTIQLPAGLTAIGGQCFTSCENLVSIVVPEGVTVLPQDCFNGCSKLASVQLPQSLTTIEGFAFYVCTSLSNLVLPANVTTIGSHAFSYCTGVKRVYSLATTPPSVYNSDVLSGLKDVATLYVDPAAVSAYQAHEYWGVFSPNIVGSTKLPAEQPTFIFDEQNLRLSMASITPGTTIYYTTDDTTPTVNSARYTAPIALLKNGTVRAIAVGESWDNSLVSVFNKDDLQVNPVAATISDDFLVTLTCDVPDVMGLPETKLYYVKNRSAYETTGDEWQLYEEPFRLTTAGYIHTKAVREGWKDSNLGHYDYYTDYYLASPSISSNSTEHTVTLTHNNAEAAIYYTLDGTDPNQGGVLYDGNPVQLVQNSVVTAIAKKSGAISSDPVTREYNWFTAATPTFKVEHLAVVIDCAEPATAKIHYTTDGTEPTEESPVYTEPLQLAKDCSVRAIAVADHWNTSSLGRYTYTKSNFTLTTPRFSPLSYGEISLNADSTFTITVPEGSTVYYTLDGTEPTAESMKYEQAVKLTQNCTVKAVAMQTDWFNSPTVEAAVSYFKVKQPAIAFNGKYAEISCATDGVAIYYTTDRSTPDVSSSTTKVYTGPIEMPKEQTYLRAIAIKENWTNSDVSAERTFTPSSIHYAETPTLIRVAGTDKVQIDTRTADGSIYYTVDGLNPTTGSNLYSEPVTMTQNCTVKAITTNAMLFDSDVSTFAVDWFKVDQPVITSDGINVTITCPKEGAKIYYTLDGTTPTENSTLYDGALTMKESLTIKAIATYENFNNSNEAVFNYYTSENTTGKPTFTRTGNTVAIASEPVEGTVIYYTTDGLEPTTASDVYTTPIEVTENCVIKALAVNAKLFTSEVSTYDVNWFKVEQPVIVFDGIHMSISCATPNSRIYYTLDGSSPNEESLRYMQTLPMTSSCTVKAVAMRDNFNNSAVATTSFDKTANTVSTPQFQKNGNNVTIVATPAEGTTIYYTLDGSEPTAESTVYTAAIATTENATLKALAVNDKLFASEVASYDVNWFKVETPVLSLDGNQLTMVCSTADATIYYAYGEQPTTESAVYSGPITLVDNRQVQAVAMKKNFNNSEVATVEPSLFVCDAVTFSYDGRYLTMTTGEGQTAYYTTDGTKPSESSAAYSGKVEIADLCTVRAIAKRQDFRDAQETSYTVTYLYDGENASLSEAGHLEDVFQWIGSTSNVETLPVSGKLNQKDLNFIRTITSLRHLDLTDASIEGNALPDKAFANLPLLSVAMPSQLSSAGDHLFEGCTELAAIVWNSNLNVPQTVIDDIKNPNMLLYVNSRVYVPTNYNGNLISGGEATSITLTDAASGSNFYCPQRFYAQHISYTHRYGQPTESGVSRGWETLSLPFDVQTITHEKRGAMAPFGKGEDIQKFKPFWLYELTETGFVRTGDIKAYTPYIVSMPNQANYADDYILAGNVTYTAANTYVEADASNVTTKGSVRFTPSLQHQAQSASILTINLEDYTDQEGMFYLSGSAFLPNMRAARPFEAYALVQGGVPAPMLVRSFVWDANDTAIREVEMKQLEKLGDVRGVYDLQGRHLGNDSSVLEKKRGQHQRVVIVNGKKTLVK